MIAAAPARIDRRERPEVVREPATGVDLLPPVREVRVLAVLLRTPAGEVLGGARHAARPEGLLLEPSKVCEAELGDEVRVLAEGAGLPSPPGLGRQVERRVQGRSDADGDVLLPCDVRELPDGVDIAQRGEAERLGPLGERLGGEGHPGVLEERVPRVGRDGDGDAVRRALGQRLERVVPPGGRPGILERVDVEVRQVLVEDHDARRGLADPPGVLEHRAVLAGLDDRLEHQAGLLLERQPSDEVLDA